MAEKISLQDYRNERDLFQSRAVFALGAVAVAAAILILRLIYLQIISHEHFATLSRDNSIKLEAIPPVRGLIYDRRGILVAENLPSFSLDLIPEQVTDMDATLAGLGTVVSITETDITRFRRLLRKSRRFEQVPLRLRLSEEEVAAFAINRHRFPGVDIRARLTRYYAHGELTAHSVGYVARISEDDLAKLNPNEYTNITHIGRIGVEKAFEDVLRGAAGLERREVNAAGRALRSLDRRAPTPGAALHLALDLQLQQAATQALGNFRGAVVALDPNTWEVLALVSRPSFDPNGFVLGVEAEDFRSLETHEDQPLFNRALRGQYPPGSTIKPLLGLAALEYGLPRATGTVNCTGEMALAGEERKYRCWRREGHGGVGLHEAIAQSCDVYFYELGLALGIDRMHEFLSRFGFGQASGLDIGGDQRGLMPSREWKRKRFRQPWYPGESLIAGIGQGYMLATPLQMATSTAALITGREPQPPHVVHQVLTSGGGAPLPRAAEPAERAPLSAHAKRIYDAMVAVVHGPTGTARSIGVGAPYRLGGKTGTAQVVAMKEDEKYDHAKMAERLRDHALFIGFAPAEAPRIVVAVIVENAGGGGANAAPVARQVMDRYLIEPRP